MKRLTKCQVRHVINVVVDVIRCSESLALDSERDRAELVVRMLKGITGAQREVA